MAPAGASNPVSEAVAVSTELAAGAIGAGGKIAAATVDMAKNAAGTLAAVTTGASPDPSSDDSEAGDRKGRGRRKSS
jgi:hypothetical protein